MKASDRREIEKLIHSGINEAIGDAAEYFDYLADRLTRIEEHLKMDVPSYPEALAARYGKKEE